MYPNHEKIKTKLDALAQISGVELAILADEKGFPLSSTCDIGKAEKFSALLTSLTQRINSVLKELELDVAKHIELKTTSKELLITITETSNLIVLREKE